MAVLDNLFVVALEQAVAAPYCTRLMAENGARVVKLERQEGDFSRAYDKVVNGESAYFTWLNGGKESLVVDVKDPADLALVKRMLKKADVFIQNLRPGAADRLDLDYQSLKATNETIIVCNISGYGQKGPYAEMKAYDALVQAETALCSVTGPPGSPSKVGASICDIATGLTAYSEILKALYNREKTAEGANIELSLFGVLSEWMSVPLAYYEYGGKLLGGTGLDHAQVAPYGNFNVSDGSVFLVIQNNREWGNFCNLVLEQPELMSDKMFHDNASRVQNLISLKEVINRSFSEFSRDAIIKKLFAAGIACGNVNTVADLAQHPALLRKRVTSGDKVFDTVNHVGSYAASSKIPALNEQGASIRREFFK